MPLKNSMAEPLGPVPVPPRPAEAPLSSGDRLDSWKEIATHLGREVRTVQGWEKNEGLPIHRHQHARQGSVYAFRSELDAWRAARKNVSDATVPEETSGSPGESPRSGKWLAIGVIALVIVAVVSGILLWRNRAAASEQITSVVVLPFADFSPQHDQEYFSDGLTEEIIDALSRVPNLRVVARTSAFVFKGKANDIRQIGKQFDVGAVLEGSVRKDGDKLRITAQLNRVSDGTHLWSHTYDRQLRDVFAVQHELSQSIASELRAGSVPERRGTSDLEAYQSYQEGRFFFNQQDEPGYRKAIVRFQQAIDRDPKFALAYCGLADTYAYLAENFMEAPKVSMPKAKEAASKALALDDNLAESHISMGIVKLDYEWDREGGQAEFKRALQINPGSAWAHHWYAHSLETQGRLDDAMKEMRTALAMDPLSLVFYWDVAAELMGKRQYDEVIAHIKRGEELFPTFFLLMWEQAEAYYAKHDMQAAHQVIEKMKSSNPELADAPAFIALIGIAAAREGRREEAQRLLDKLETLHQTQYVESMLVVELTSAMGAHDRMKVWFDRMKEDRSSLYLYLPMAVQGSAEHDPELTKLADTIGQ
jgi:TolB-like protein